MCKKLIYLTCFALVLGISGQAMAAIRVAEELLVDLRAEDLDYGSSVTTWPNHGTLGDFTTIEGTPVVEDVTGRKAVTFDGFSWFTGPTSPPGIEGEGTRSIEVWAYNPTIDTHETMVSWSHRGGPAGTNMAFTYGNHGTWGAVGHWDAADMAWSNPHVPAPAAENWWYLVYTYDGTTARLYVNGVANTINAFPLNTHSGGFIRVAAQADDTGAGASPNDRFSGSIAEMRIHDGVLSPSDIAYNFVSKPGGQMARDLNPEHGQIDVPREVVLIWEPGEFANTHDVYFGTDFDDVNDATIADPRGVTISQGQNENTFNTGRMEFGQTYFWRVDEVNDAHPDSPWKGDVWSFTTEPVAYPLAMAHITATASGMKNANENPTNTIDGSGLDENDIHSTSPNTMWLSDISTPGETWIRYDFDQLYKLHQVLVWNHNSDLEDVVGFGIKEALIETSQDGETWETVGTIELAQAAQQAPIDLQDIIARNVRITAMSNWGGIFQQYGLSEVRFLYIPVRAREPQPDSGATGVNLDVTLSWRAGREAAGHDVYLNTDSQAVIDGTAPVVTVNEASYGPLSLDLGKTYYWRVDEVNDAETPTTWQGNIWNFSSRDYLVVDDFEDYNDYPPDRIFDKWTDGWGIATNGSTIGYPEPIFVQDEHFLETTIVHSGSQSAPFSYDNSVASLSEVTVNLSDLPIGTDWSTGAAETLVLWFYGDANNATTENMYVKINGSTPVEYDGDSNNIARRRWTQWNIDLASLNVDISDVTSLSIGFERTGAAGGSGTILLDDIRLYRLAPPIPVPTDPGTTGLIAYYTMENNVEDSSGNNLHGTIMGDAGFDAGITGMALELDGVDDYVDCGTAASLDITEEITISAWINSNTFGDWRGIVTKGVENSPYSMQMWGDGALRFSANSFSNVGAVGGGSQNSTVTMTLGQWTHVAVTYRNPDLTLYINGNGETFSPGYTLGTINEPLTLGCDFPGGDEYFDGLLDEVRIYDRALSEAEILFLANL